MNSIGANSHRGGKKSEAYKRLYDDVESAATAEIARTGWSKASCECLAIIVRYVADRRTHDAMNLGKCEFDALTAAGVWVDDSLANPPMPWIRFDGDGAHRVLIVVAKLYRSVVEIRDVPKSPQAPIRRLAGSDASRRAEVGTSAVLESWRPGDPIPHGYALLNGKLVTRAFALEKAGIS